MDGAVVALEAVVTANLGDYVGGIDCFGNRTKVFWTGSRGSKVS